jgi:hypothetical protein
LDVVGASEATKELEEDGEMKTKQQKNKVEFLLSAGKCKDCDLVIAPVKTATANVVMCEVEPVSFSYSGVGKPSEFIDNNLNKVNGYENKESSLRLLRVHICSGKRKPTNQPTNQPCLILQAFQ